MKDVINYAWPVTSINKEDIDALFEWITKKKEEAYSKEIAIWGAGIRGTEFSILLKKKNIERIVFVDNNEQKWGGLINEFPIISPKELEEKMNIGQTHILISTENSKEIEDALTTKGYRRDKDFSVVKSKIYSNYLNEFLRVYERKILVMGDCEFSKISLSDVDIRNLGEMLKAECGNKQTKVLAMHGMGLRAHYNIFKAQIARGMKPQVLVIMINLDTLTGKQHLLPRAQHSELLQMIYDLSDNNDEEFCQYLELSNERSKNLQVEFLTINRGIDQLTSNNIKAKNYFRLNYMYDLKEDTEGIIYLKKILYDARQLGVEVISFIPPVNYLFAEKLIGEDFTNSYKKNVEKIKKVVKEANAKLLDMSFCLSSDMFAEPDTPDETANEFGRKKLAYTLKNELIKEA